MGILDALKSAGRGIAAIPGVLNEARYTHQPRMIPIGKDPFTGEDITLSEDEIEQGMYDPQSGQIVMPEQPGPSNRTGMSRFGQVVSNMPRMLDAGIAAASQPGDGTGGALAFIKGIGIGQRHNQQRDIMAYQMQRQRQQDAAAESERRSREAENLAQADMYRRKAEEGPADPLATLKARANAAGIQPGTPAYQEFMRTNGASTEQKQPFFQTIDQMYMWRWQNEKDPAIKQQILDDMMKAKAKPEATKPPPTQGAAWRDVGNGQEEQFVSTWDSAGGKWVAQPVEGSRRKKQLKGTGGKGGGGKKREATIAQWDAIERDKSKAIADAQDEYDKKIAELSGSKQARDSDFQAAKSRLENAKLQAQRTYEQRIRSAGGQVTQTWNPMSKPAAPGGGPKFLDVAAGYPGK